MKDKFKQLLDKNVNLKDCIGFLRQLYSQGESQESVYKVLIELRNDFLHDESKEDLILEIMDIVTGYCSPHVKVW